MIDITVKDILKISKGKLITGKEETICNQYTNTTQDIKQGDIFVRINGRKNKWKHLL